MGAGAGGGGIGETRTIDRIPESERHGSPRDQFTLWFAANLQITAVVDGALAVIFGAEALTAIAGLAAGNLLGGIFMALHSAQGPRLGLPQMISSRAQFGVKGATLPLLLVILMYLGFSATGTVLSGQAISLLLGIGNPAVGMIVFGAATAIIAIFGYRVIHLIGRIATVVSILGFGYLAWQLFRQHDVGSAFGQRPATMAAFLFSMALSAGWQLTFAPYVADYSRYLPSATSHARTFSCTFLGSAIAAQIAMTFGVLIAALGAEFLSNQVEFLGSLAGHGAPLVYIVIASGKLTVNCLNAYGGFMALLTAFTAFNRRSRVSPSARALLILAFVGLSLVFALLASANFLAVFKNFMLLLLAVFTPWSAVNLVDYYLVSKEKVDVPALYDPAGRYGAYNWTALGCYLLGVVIQIPFLNQPLYQGPIAGMLHGADISWIVSLAVTGALYYALERNSAAVPGQMILEAPAGGAGGREHPAPGGAVHAPPDLR